MCKYCEEIGLSEKFYNRDKGYFPRTERQADVLLMRSEYARVAVDHYKELREIEKEHGKNFYINIKNKIKHEEGEIEYFSKMQAEGSQLIVSASKLKLIMLKRINRRTASDYLADEKEVLTDVLNGYDFDNIGKLVKLLMQIINPKI